MKIAWIPWALGVAGLCSLAAAQIDDPATLHELRGSLSQMEKYQPGDDSAPLVAVERIVFQLPPDAKIRADVEQSLIDALQHATSHHAKAFLCEQLRIVESEAAIPILQQQLTDPDVAFLARRALTRLDSPQVDAALRRALETTSGDLKIGIINSLADRRSRESLDSIAALLDESEPAVAASAARALGRFGGHQATQALLAVVGRKEIQPDLLNALLESAQQFVVAGDLPAAASVYAALQSPDFPAAFQFAGWKGALLNCNSDIAPLVAAIERGDADNRAIALAAEVQPTNSILTQRLVGLLDSSSAEKQVLLIRALQRRGDSHAAPALEKLAESSVEDVRLAALDALGTVGVDHSIQTLVRAAAKDDEAGKVARRSLTIINGDFVVPMLAKLAFDSDDSEAAAAIEAYAHRDSPDSADTLLKLANSSRKPVRQAAVAALSRTVSRDHFPQFIGLAATAQGLAERALFRSSFDVAVARLVANEEDLDHSAIAEWMVSVIRDAPPDVQPLLVPALRFVGSAAALNSVESFLRRRQSELHRAALEALALWPKPAAVDLIRAEIHRKDLGPEERELALSGFVRLAAMDSQAPQLFLEMIQSLDNVNEQKLVLAALGQSNADSPEALAAAMSFSGPGPLQATSGLAALRIANRLRQKDAPGAKRTLEKIVATVENQDVKNRAQEVINDMEKYEDHLVVWESVGPYTDPKKLSGAEIYATEFGPERGDANLDWKPITSGVDDWQVNLEQTYGALDFVAAYCRARVWSPRPMEAQLEMGADDGIRAWVNGVKVYDEYSGGGVTPRQYRAPIQLKQGWNEILVKVVDHQGGWGFCCRVRDRDGTHLKELKFDTK